MTFLQALEKVLAPYLLVAAGFAAGKILRLQKEHFARLLIYFLGPVVVFAAAAQAPLDPAFIALPFVFFAFCSLIGFASLKLAGRLFQAPKSHVLAFACGNANSGYFGIPVGIALFGGEALSTIVFCSFGFILYANTAGHRANFTAQAKPANGRSREKRSSSAIAMPISIMPQTE